MAALMVDAVGVLGGSEHDEEDQLLFDLMEAMRRVGGNKDDRARRHGADLVADGDSSPARNHVVDLVLGVRILGIDATGRQDVDANRQVVRTHELVVEPSRNRLGRQEIVELEGLHRGRG